jgi:cytochrome P450
VQCHRAGGPLSIGLSDTLAGFLANALHNLIGDPDQFARLAQKVT